MGNNYICLFNDFAKLVLDECPTMKTLNYIDKNGYGDLLDEDLSVALKERAVDVLHEEVIKTLR